MRPTTTDQSKYLQDYFMKKRHEGDFDATGFNASFSFFEFLIKLNLVTKLTGMTAMEDLSWRDVKSYEQHTR